MPKESLGRRKSFLKTCKTAEDEEGEGVLKVKPASSATRFLGRLRTRVFGRRLAITLEGDNTSESTIVAPSKLISHNPSSIQEAAGDSPRGCRRAAAAAASHQEDTCPVGYKCHICNFIADRITLLDRHLLDDHKLGMDNLLKLVIAKTMAREKSPTRSSMAFYQLSDMSVELDAESVFERIRNSQPKEFRTVATNTVDLNSAMSLKDSCNEITKQLETLLSVPLEKYDQGSLLTKMASLNELMCHVMESSNNLNLKTLEPPRPAQTTSAARHILDLSLDDFLTSPHVTAL